MQIILNAPDFFKSNYRGYLEQNIFNALASKIGDVTFLLSTSNIYSHQSPHINVKLCEPIPQKGLFLKKKQQNWFQRHPASFYVSFHKMAYKEIKSQNIFLIDCLDDTKQGFTPTDSDILLFTSGYLLDQFKKTYPNQKNEMHLLERLINPDFFKTEEKEDESIKKELTAGREYFICTDFDLQKENFVTLLKAFSVFKRMQQSNFKLVIVLRSTDSIDLQSAQALLANYKYRNDIVLTDKCNLNKKIAGAYSLISFSQKEIFPVPVAEALQSKIPVIAAFTETIKIMYGDTVLYPPDNGKEAFGNLLMTMYKSETFRQGIIKKISETYTQKSISYTTNIIQQIISQYRQLI